MVRVNPALLVLVGLAWLAMRAPQRNPRRRTAAVSGPKPGKWYAYMDSEAAGVRRAPIGTGPMPAHTNEDLAQALEWAARVKWGAMRVHFDNTGPGAAAEIEAFRDRARRLGYDLEHVRQGKGDKTWRFRVARAGRPARGDSQLAMFNPTRPPRIRLRNIDAFYRRGVIHPIRASAGYDPEVEQMQREGRHEATRADFYADEPAERGPKMDRPPWSVGISNAVLERYAKEHGENAYSEGWWERAGLYAHKKPARSKYLADSGSKKDRGELEDVASFLRADRRGGGSARVAAGHKADQRARTRGRDKKVEDLPW